MKVYLLRLEGMPRPVFYAEIPHGLESTRRDEQGRPIRTWAERQFRNLKALVRRVGRQPHSPRFQRFWDWLNRRPPPDETLLRVLRMASTIEVFHPALMGEDRARLTWRRYLDSRLREHLVTLAWDLALSPLIALLMVMPGPNVLGYWFLFRILSHMLAMRGIARARWGWASVTYQATDALNHALQGAPEAEDPNLARLQREFCLEHLGLYLARVSERRRGRGNRPSPGVIPPGSLPPCEANQGAADGL